MKPVPPKFLLEWLEGASLEDENDDELNTLWAELLRDDRADYCRVTGVGDHAAVEAPVDLEAWLRASGLAGVLLMH